ncbi:MAG TPA: CARDB domain-containing protein, partial [Verrucomicrobiae bacterium]|nr:CARDB domain-containing protein [Verrucomicrobiae bacterium]
LLGGDNETSAIGWTPSPINVQLVTPGFFHVKSVQVAPSPPTVTWPGQQITCTYVVQNSGQTAITGRWEDWITLSSVSNYAIGDTIAYEVAVNVAGPLAPGATYTNSGQFTLPQTVQGLNVTGTWFVAPLVNDIFHYGADGNVGRDELAAPLDVTTPPPADLQVTSISAPTNAYEGQSINVAWMVANDGNNQTSSSYWYDAIYLSTNSTFDPTQSILIGTYGYFGVLGLTSNYTQNVSVIVPANLFTANIPAKIYYLFVDADAGNNVFELDKTNNVLGAANPLLIQPAPQSSRLIWR